MTMSNAEILDRLDAKNATVKLTATERQRIKAIATFRQRTPHFIMKEAIQWYLQNAEAEQNFIQAGETAWADYEETGLHVTLDEAKAWAKALKTDPTATLVPCHT
jgi:predicted transcriptional regulator